MIENSSSTKLSFVKQFLLYSIFRLGLWVLISLIIIGFGLLLGIEVPIFVALFLGIFIATPLSFVLGKTMRHTFLARIIRLDSHRREHRSALLEQLQSPSCDLSADTDIEKSERLR